MDRIEELERRQLLAGITVTAAPGGLIRIAGTSGNDHVDVAFFGSNQIQITDGVTDVKFLRTEVKKITFVGGDGDDFITLGRVVAKAYLDGGNGNDSLSASAAGDSGDTLLGEDGNDYLWGGPGNDSIDGGNGGDFEIGSTGDDFLQCKSEVNTDDTISGGKGNDTVSLSTYTSNTLTTIGHRNNGLQQTITDTLYGDIETFVGSSKNDTVFDYSNRSITYDMGAGDDAVYAGQGNDTIVGEDGKDSLNGGGGDDVFYVAGDGAIDSVVGGAGTDKANADSNDVLKGIESEFSPLPSPIIN